jgi:hypothetical protein
VSTLLAIGRDVPYVMSQVGHADSSMTLETYARVMSRREGERAELRALVEGAGSAELDELTVRLAA